MNTRDQHRMVARTERAWAASAFRDEHSNLIAAHEDAKKGNRVLQHMHEQEAGWDRFWGKRRLGIARRNSR
jgi:hypothetical protein